MINITIKKKHLYVLVATLVAIAIAVPAISIAADRFTDVPDSNVFHNDIAWLADNGITRGCNPPTNSRYCPDGNVTRGQMAAFMKRFHDRFVTAPLSANAVERPQTISPDFGNGVVDGLSMDLRVPRPGLLVVEASAEVFNEVDSDRFACGINTGDQVDFAQLDSWRGIDLTTDVSETCSTMTVFPVSAGVQTVRLVIVNALGSTGVGAGSLTAVLYPFDGVTPLTKTSGESGPAEEVTDAPKG